MIDGNRLIQEQLGLTGPRVIELEGGKKTPMAPVRIVPELASDAMRVSLNGTWRCTRWPFAEDEAELASVRCDDTHWERVEQPGKVFYYDPEQKPSSVRNYNRVTLAHIDPEDGAVIRRTVPLPAEWDGKRLYLRFEGVYPACRVYCNGTLLGEHLSGLTPVEWDVTDVAVAGQPALVAVRLLRRHRFVQLDMPRHALEFTGLSQDAFFHATEPCHIAGYHLRARLDESLTVGHIEGTVSLANLGGGRGKCKLEVLVTDPSHRKAAAFTAALDIEKGAARDVEVRLPLEGVQTWSDEAPNLYRVIIRLDVEGSPTQEVSHRAGFRRLDLAGGRPLLNGKPIKFRGVNHLTFHPEGGMYTPEDWLRKCLTLMKHANVNAIRTHFLGPKVLAGLCDELGLYLVQELPIDWGTDYIDDPEWVGPVLMRIQGGVTRDRHHPSVMVWAVGNENLPKTAAGYEDAFNHLRTFHRLVKTLDPDRPTMFPPPGPANQIEGIFETRVGDIADTHYSFKLVRKFNETGRMSNPKSWDRAMETTTREEALARGWSGVWFSSEYGIFNYHPDLLHAPYLSIIADRMPDPLSGRSTLEEFTQRLSEEWGYMRDDPTCLGGAYFPWLCAGAGNPWGWVRWGEDADWGVVTAELLPKPAFWAMRAIFSPIRFPERLSWRPGTSELEFPLYNGFNGIRLEDCTLRTLMGGGPPYMGMLREWRDVPVAGAPGETATVRIPLWNEGSVRTLEKGAPIVCRCVFLDPSGYRTIMADILVSPAQEGEVKTAMPIGPDAA